MVKKSTGIAGLDVVPNAREVLIKLYEKALTDVKVMPEHVVYRQVVEEFTSFRLQIVKRHEDVSQPAAPPCLLRCCCCCCCEG